MKPKTYNQLIYLMKLSVGQLLLITLLCNLTFATDLKGQKSENVFEVELEMSVKDKSILDVFMDIESRTKFKFALDKKILKSKPKVSVEENTIGDVLSSISSQAKLNFRQVNDVIAVTEPKGKDTTPVEVLIYDKNIQGKVIDSETGDPLIGATVKVKGTQIGTITDVDGNFSLSVPDDAEFLVVSYVGFLSQEVALGNQTLFNVSLDPDISSLNEVVVTALGVEKEKKALSYSTQQVASEEVNKSRNGDLLNQISGRVPGLQIQQNSSGVASSSRVVLRGESSLSFGSNQPLFVVDGIPINNNINSSDRGDQTVDFGNGILDLNPDDIASVSVLKGPNAAALYGSRAANGAIVITTKSGQRGSGVVVDITSGVTFEEVTRVLDLQNQYSAGQNLEYREDWGWNWGAPLDGTPTAQGESPSFPDELPLEHRRNIEDFFETGITFNNNISVSVGGERNTIRFSLTDLRKTGVIPNNDYFKTNFSVKSSSQLSDKWSVDLVANYVNSGSDNITSTRYGSTGLMYQFYWSHANADLDWFRDYWVEGRENIEQKNWLTWSDNPFMVVNEHINSFQKDRVFGNAKVNLDLNENFRFHARIGTDFSNEEQVSRRPWSSRSFPQGMYSEAGVTFQETNVDVLATYNNTFSNETGLNISIGANHMQQDNNRSSLFGNGLAIPGLYNPGNISTTPELSRFDASRRINSLYGNIEFSLKSSIFFNLTGRNDWSSTLPSENNSYFYPSFGTSVIVSDLVELPNAISYAKVRSSWAQVGNDTDPFLINRAYDFGRLPSSIENQSLLPNTDIEPESTNSFEVGAELGLFSNRVLFDFTYYNINTENQIFQAPVSTASGFSNQLINAGQIQNKGVELLASFVPVRTDAIDWTLSVNFARNRSEVKELAPGVESLVLFSYFNATVEARPGDQFGVIYGNVLERNENGDVIFENGIPLISSERQRIGQVSPDWTSGILSSLRFKQFTLDVFMDYRSGGTIYSNSSAQLYRGGNNDESTVGREDGVVGVGVVQNADGSYSPNEVNVSARSYYQNYYSRNGLTDVHSADASFFKIREVALGVNLTDFIEIVGLSRLHLGLFGRNLFVRAKSDALRHFDPEVSLVDNGRIIPGLESAQLPGTSTYGFNINLQLK
jgi:TonB-linked SusC/RagA family outer membrane protein